VPWFGLFRDGGERQCGQCGVAEQVSTENTLFKYIIFEEKVKFEENGL